LAALEAAERPNCGTRRLPDLSLYELDLVSRIDVPLVHLLDVTFFNQPFVTLSKVESRRSLVSFQSGNYIRPDHTEENAQKASTFSAFLL